MATDDNWSQSVGQYIAIKTSSGKTPPISILIDGLEKQQQICVCSVAF
jgi:hypothetical protein